MNKDLISGFDLSAKDINESFLLAAKMKKEKTGVHLKGRTVALIFQKPSMRTRISFEVGARQLGADCVYLSPEDIKLGLREPIKDIARVLSRYVDLIVARTFEHAHILELSRYSTISVINGLSDSFHPCQALADIYTIYEKKAKLEGLTLAYIGDGNNVLHSLLAIAGKVGISMNISTPKGYEPDAEVLAEALKIAKKTDAKIIKFSSPKDAVKDADFVYTDVWTSMGQEKEVEQRRKAFKGFQINKELLKAAKKGCMVMHCMPAHRGEEITDEVMEAKESIIYDQAENRLHLQKAIMAMLLR